MIKGLLHCYTRDFIATQVASERCNMLRDHKATQHFCCNLQEALHEVELGSAFRNDVATHFGHIAQSNIPFATCLAIFLLTS